MTTIKYRLCLRHVFQSLVIAAIFGCQGLLDVDDPTLVQDKDVANESGANSRRLDAVFQFNTHATSLANYVALFTDERQLDEPAYYSNTEFRNLDLRNGEWLGGQFETYLGNWTDIIIRTSIGIGSVRTYSPDSVRGDFLAQLFGLRGYAALQMAEDLCSGFPINDVINDQPRFGGPLSTDSATRYALAQIDSSLKYVQDSSHFRELARVLKGRALLDLGLYDQAAVAVTQVPVNFVYVIERGVGANALWMRPSDWINGRRMVVGEKEGTNGLPFVSASDPRVPTLFKAVRYNDPTDSLYDQTKYTHQYAPMTIATGVEAYLIRAEAALKSGDPDWLALLNTPRREAIIPRMTDLEDPGTPAGRVDLLYRERAFWLYLTGRRLGDLRRLMRNYQRDPQTLFPIGDYPFGGSYKTATSIQFKIEMLQRYNPKITGCTDP